MLSDKSWENLCCFIAVCQYWGIYLILLTKISKTLVNRCLTLVCRGSIRLLSVSRAFRSSEVIHAHMSVIDLYFIELTVKVLIQVWNIFVPSYITGLFYITVILLQFSSGLSEVRFLFASNTFFFFPNNIQQWVCYPTVFIWISHAVLK